MTTFLTDARRLLADQAGPDLAAHTAAHGPLVWPRRPADLVSAVTAAGLTGRGGAGFPTGRKLSAVAAAVAATGRPAVAVANGSEGEPASHKDRALLTLAPHLVLDGLQLAAYAVGAGEVHLYVAGAVRPTVEAALAQRRDRLHATVHTAPEWFVAGEESAVVAAVSGRPGVPADKTRRVVESGVDGAPTLVQNVETLAHLALIARHGPGWLRAYGTPDEPGTFLATISGAVASPGVAELPYGVALGDALAAAGGASERLRAVLVGGFHGAWVPADPRLPLSRAGLARHWATPGAGVVLALPAGACGLAETARIVSYLAGESAGQCGPCVNGLPRLAESLSDLARRRARPNLPAEIDRLAAVVTGRGACRHPDGTARLIRSALYAFADDVHAHLAGACVAS